MEVLECIEKMETVAKSNQEVRDMRFNCQNLKGGRQGDVYIVRADTAADIKKIEKMIQKNSNKMWSNFSFGNEFEERKTTQLASGTSKGSRHIFKGKGKVLFSKNGHPCAGGIIEAKEEWTLEHPEHAHFKYPKARFVFWFQLDARKEREVARVQD